MGLFGRRAGRRGGGGVAPTAGRGRGGLADDYRLHLDAFVATRRGIEAYVEPATTVTPVTVVLVAHDGEWTRRPVGDEEAAHAFAKGHRIPCYLVRATGYPPRMRAWSAARKRAGGDGQPAAQRRRPTDTEMPPDPFA